MFLSWVMCVILLYLVYEANRRKRRSIPNVNVSELYTDDMSDFEKASTYVSSGLCHMSDGAKLAIYGYFKQATQGDNHSPSPSSLDLVASAKWKAWEACRGMTEEEAKAKYVEFVTKLSPEWLQGKENEKGEDSTDGGFGLKVSTMQLGSESDWKEGTDVFYYMGNKDDAKVLSFIEANPNRLNEKDAEGRSLLHWACDRGSEAVVKRLLECHVDVNGRDNEGLTPLDYACYCEREDIAKLLLENGARLSECQEDSLELLSPTLRSQFK
ncbi:hypothetical protein WA588_002132 [Blastocystis sp. NMH]